MISMPDDLRKLIEGSPIPCRIVAGSKHYKIYVADRMVTVLPKAKAARSYQGRAHINALANVRRAIKTEQAK